MYPDINPYRTGKLQVSSIHTLHYEICGNENGVPGMNATGGPGSGFHPRDRRFFNPEKYKIILLDQRGSGKSTPKGSTEENTTWDLVRDLEQLREELKIRKWHVFGGSWGTTLALAYAQSRPERVQGLVLRGIYMCSKSQHRFVMQEGANHIFPEAWSDYVSIIPEPERVDMMRAYHRLLHSSDKETRLRAARSWTRWESTLSKVRRDPCAFELGPDEDVYAKAVIETHYFMHNGWLREDQLLGKEEIDKIRHIPTVVVQGRYDMLCPPTTAWKLKKVWPEIELHIVPDAGHSSSEPGIEKLLVEATDKFAEILT
ncbi:proline iminopeptidase [Marasmius fiardii PR-910]|nr:proline iminopeptidase [Marasmius fiardii PR-910]